MDKTNEKHFGLRVDGDILAKFRYVCGFEGRSANAQIIQLMLFFNTCGMQSILDWTVQMK